MTSRLFKVARGNWTIFDGEMTSRNIDALRLRPDKFCNLVFWWACKSIAAQEDGDKKLTEFETKLWLPPAGEAVSKDSPWSPENEMASFAQFGAQFQSMQDTMVERDGPLDGPE